MVQPRILLLDADSRVDHYRPLMEALDATWLTPPWPTSAGAPVDWRDADIARPPWLAVNGTPATELDLILVTSEWPPHIGTTLVEYARAGIPVLQIAEGIVEWRQIWENAGMWDSAPMYQPILSHKIACLGRAQARVLESWGNIGKCEVTGSPRFDSLIGRSPRHRPEGDPCRVLICTATTLGFSARQRSVLGNGLKKLKAQLEANWGAEIEPVWRVGPDIEAGLGVVNDRNHRALADALAHVDAVITTPSTVLLEGMLHGLPVAALDFTNSPQYVRTAWTITAPGHIDPVLEGLVKPSPTRKLFQDFVLHDELECHTEATSRVTELALGMIEIGRRCRADGKALDFPSTMLRDPRLGHHLPDPGYDLEALYPRREALSRDVTSLQSEILQLRRLIRMERDRFERWAHWEIGNQILVGTKVAARGFARMLGLSSSS
jgi:hypothetical protein